MKGYYNIGFSGACADSIIVLCESNGIRWKKEGTWTTVYGCGKEIIDLIMETATSYKTF